MTATNTDLLALADQFSNAPGSLSIDDRFRIILTGDERDQVCAALRTAATQKAEIARLNKTLAEILYATTDPYLKNESARLDKVFRLSNDAALTTQEKP